MSPVTFRPCGWTHDASEVRAIGRFAPGGPLGYRAWSVPDAPLRTTRAEAERDYCQHMHTTRED
ncbi:MAG: hypothetical protein ACO1ON_12960 [Nocardioides sp.]